MYQEVKQTFKRCSAAFGACDVPAKKEYLKIPKFYRYEVRTTSVYKEDEHGKRC